MTSTITGVKTVEGLARNKATPYIIGGVVLVGLGLTYFGIVRPILCATGIADCKKGKKMRSIMSYKGFDPNYSRQGKVTISHDRAKKLAEQLYDSGGVFNDDEGGFYSALEEAGNADNLSLIARMFAAKYKKSLAEYITYYMDDAREMQRIKDIINSY
ncbi:MAG: hypothetical protein CMD31_13055 [Flavobacteriales bacterium]|nr:hypothetical protein [Flavobacteriales bacterium]|tara:strand:- start:33951 stop:34424 length:474 start_codon:yes stop_codon:yes gene_type:complete